MIKEIQEMNNVKKTLTRIKKLEKKRLKKGKELTIMSLWKQIVKKKEEVNRKRSE